MAVVGQGFPRGISLLGQELKLTPFTKPCALTTQLGAERTVERVNYVGATGAGRGPTVGLRESSGWSGDRSNLSRGCLEPSRGSLFSPPYFPPLR